MSASGTPSKKALGPELIIPALAFGFTLYYFGTVWDLAWEAKADGLAIGGILLVLIALLLVRIGVQLARGHASLSMDPLIRPWAPQAKRLALVAAIATFIFLLPYLGFTPATALFMIAAMLILGVRSPLPLAAVSLAVAGGGYILFIAFLDARFPRGPVEQFLKSLF
jgi:hypothetical protein